VESFVQIFFGIVFIGIALWEFVSLFVKRMRMKWKGTNQQVGPVSIMGGFLVFGCGGIAMIFDMKQLPPIVSLPFLLGFLFAGIGSFVDTRQKS
jgi:hypothetical protein